MTSQIKASPVYQIFSVLAGIVSMIAIGSFLWSIATSQTKIQMTVESTAKVMNERTDMFKEIYQEQGRTKDAVETLTLDMRRLEGSQISFVHADGINMIVRSPNGQIYTIPIKSTIIKPDD